MPNPGVLLSTLDSRYPAKHFEIDGVGTQEGGREQMQFLPFGVGAAGRDKVTLRLSLPLMQVSCGDSGSDAFAVRGNERARVRSKCDLGAKSKEAQRRQCGSTGS